MNKFLAIIGISLMLVSCASAGTARESDRHSFGKPVANPSAIVKAELSFARLAREKGQWAAFRETAASDAVIFVPKLTNAQEWLKDKVEPPSAVEWQPHKIYMSCDGSLAVSTGAWQRGDGTTGRFVTIWQQQNFGARKRGKETEWKWVFDHGVPLSKPLPEPEFVQSKVASCKGPVYTEAAEDGVRGVSQDWTMQWVANDQPNDIRTLNVAIWNGSDFDIIVDDEYPTGK